MSDYLIIVQGDHNDGDYVTKLTTVSAQEYKEVKKLLQTISDAIKNCEEQYNWPNSWGLDGSPEKLYNNILNKSDINAFEEVYAPWHSNGIHSIVSIEVYPIKKAQKFI